MKGAEDENKVIALGDAASAGSLPYAIELWDMSRGAPERIIGRAASMVLARAIFTAAQTEHLGRKIVLRRGSKVMAETE